MTPTTMGLNPDLSISLASLEPAPGAPWAAGPRAGIDWAAAKGFRSVQLDAAAAGIRPRDLDRSARRDLAALLRRTQLRFTGLDLWIPSEHFVDSARVQRATEATMAAIDLAADLARLVESPRGGLVGIALPAAVPPALVQTLCAYAESRGVDLADHTVRDTRPDARLGVGLDPAGLLLAGQDPVALAARWGTAVQCARLSDASAVGRVAVAGAGSRLDVRAYRATLDVLGYSRNVVVDVRGVRDQVQALMRAREVWDPAP